MQLPCSVLSSFCQQLCKISDFCGRLWNETIMATTQVVQGSHRCYIGLMLALNSFMLRRAFKKYHSTPIF